MQFFFLLAFFVSTSSSCKKDPDLNNVEGNLQLIYLHIGTVNLNLDADAENTQIPIDQQIVINFSKQLDTSSVTSSFILSDGGTNISLTPYYLDENKTISFSHENLLNNKTYILQISNTLKGLNNESFPGYTISFSTQAGTLLINTITVSGKDLLYGERVTDVDRDLVAIIKFNHPLNPSTVNSSAIAIAKAGFTEPLNFILSDSNKTITVNSVNALTHFQKYVCTISTYLEAENPDYVFNGFTKEFYTAIDSTPKFPIVSDDELLTIVQQQTFKYFWDFAHPVSGLSPERNATPDVVTIGGSGFGVMAIIIGIDRNFITRTEGVERLNKIVDFLAAADRFHGVWPHWMDGSTGEVIPFSPNDNGADLVETSYLIHGLLTVRQYLNAADVTENDLIIKINNLWQTVEWDWFTKGGEDVLYWHWSPGLDWIMNMKIKGYNECLITYFLAAASPTHTIDAEVYHHGWASDGGFINGSSFYGFTLPLGYDYGGPLFFAHYSFLGLNPETLNDSYANYWTQNVNHTEINRAYCIDNPLKYVGYSSDCWGLTASDNQEGYNAHSPTNDLGVITPTAALASFPYTPEYAMQALKFFYYTIGDKIWGDYGFHDAFNATEGWFGNSYLAIDEGPIMIMIENYRTQLLWDLFMSCPEVSDAADKLGFTY
ncbi:MAG: Ig-like domain-containing protein [Fimbriimonadaceae bacterium]|nr:Ig-like domain-containing protein [Chitinophagales bacterium]